MVPVEPVRLEHAWYPEMTCRHLSGDLVERLSKAQAPSPKHVASAYRTRRSVGCWCDLLSKPDGADGGSGSGGWRNVLRPRL